MILLISSAKHVLLSQVTRLKRVIQGYVHTVSIITLYNPFNLVSIHSIFMLESRKQQNNNLYYHVS